MNPTPVLLLLVFGARWAAAGASVGQDETGDRKRDRLAFVGLHGGVFEQLKRFEAETGLSLEYLTDEAIAAGKVDFASYDVVFLQHLRGEDREVYRRLITDGKKRNPRLHVLAISPYAVEGMFPDLLRQGLIVHDPKLRAYYGNVRENLRRFLGYVAIRYLGREGKILPPVKVDRWGIYHPDHPGLFPNVKEFLAWCRRQGRRTEGVPRAVVAVHLTHLLLQQPKVVDALVRALEREGVLAAAMVDLSAEYEKAVREFRPDAVIHTCHSRETVGFRKSVGVPHLHSMFFRKQSIDDWRKSLQGLAPSEFAFQVVSQEILGAIEPQIGAGTIRGGGSAEAFSPIPERVEHLVGRALSWIRLVRKRNSEKKVAVIYYDREMGKAELMRGSATGMFMNGPRSLVKVLKRMKKEGYSIGPVPADEDELVEWMMERGRQIGVWAPGILDRLARSGNAVLVPEETYREWFETKVPEAQRKELVQRWGEPPGKFLVWENKGEKYIVIPRIDLGNVILLPQPLRGEAHDTSRVHDKRVPPPHNYLATYFWLQEEFRADAVVHFGTHGTEALLPGKAVGLSESDWPDMILGSMPNITPWIINNLGESSPFKRRAYAVLIDHLVPPSVNAGLSDELLNLHNDIDKWMTLGEGALKEKFRASITGQVRKENLDRDLHIDLSGGRLLTAEEIRKVLGYLHDIHTETTPVSLHVFGEPPREDLLVPYLVTCLRSRFLDGLGRVIEVPGGEALTPGDRRKFLRRKAEEIVRLIVREGFDPDEALKAVGGEGKPPKAVREGLKLAVELKEGFERTGQEMDNLMAALEGRFIPPGPANSPDRNPAVVPTGRNMYVMNPEEVPSRPSWEIGKTLIDNMLADQLKRKGRYPRKVAFTLNSFATFQDYGVIESQILYLMGVRPVWDARNLVVDVELIPAKELGRPRIDVFIAALSYYRDMLPTRMRLLDRAVRLVSSVQEKDNFVRENSERVRVGLEKKGIPAERAAKLSRARLFGYPPGQYGSAGYYYLVEKSGEWDSREELMETYLGMVRYAYTEGLWGVEAPEAYNRHIQGSEVLLRSWSDRTRSPLSNKYDWYHGGSLSLAIKYLTGKEPEWFFSDVRDPDRARIVGAEDALRKEFRVRLFNRKWIEGMMKEGYAGADQIAVHVSNTMGWKIMRENSVSDDIWEEIVDIYIRDAKKLNLREWFEAENPFAFQEITEILLETIRKGYWKADEATRLEIAQAYARSVARHGEGAGLRGGGNVKLEKFVEETLKAPGTKELEGLLAEYKARARETAEPASGEAASKRSEVKKVRGKKMERTESRPQEAPSFPVWSLIVGIGVLLVFGFGLWKRAGVPA